MTDQASSSTSPFKPDVVIRRGAVSIEISNTATEELLNKVGGLLHYDDLYSMDMFGESIEGHKYRTPYQVVKMINPNSKEDMELLREVLKNNHFDDEDE